MADGSLIFDTKVDTKGFKHGSSTLKSQAEGLGGTFRKLGLAIAAAASVKKSFDLGKQAVSLASDVQEVQNVVDTAFGDMSYKIEGFSKTSIQNFGVSQLAAKKTASTYMAMAKGMQLPADVASDMSVKLTGLTGDMSSFYNVSQDVADSALKSIFTGETESLKQFGVVMTQTNLQQFAYSQGINQSIDTMSQAQLVQLRYNYVLQQTSLAQGDFAKTSGSWANQTRVLQEQWKQFLTLLGTGLLKVLTPVIRALNGMMSQLISFATTASGMLSGLFGEDSPVSSGQKRVTSEINSSVSATEDLAGAQKALGKAVKGNLAGFDELNVLSNGSSDGGAGVAGVSVAPIVSPVIDTSGDEKSSTKIFKISENLKNALSKLADAFKPFAKKVGEGLGWFYDNVLKPLGKWVANKVVPAFLNVLAKAIGFLNSAIDTLKPLMKWLFDSFLNPLAAWTGGVVVDILNGLATVLGKIGDWIENNKGLVQTIAIIVGSFAAAWQLVNLAIGIWNAIGIIATAVTKAFGAAVAFLTSPIFLVTLAIAAIIAIVVLLIKHWNGVKNVAVTAWNAIVGVIKIAVSAIGGFFVGLWNGIKSVFSSIGTWFANAFTGALNGIKTAFGGITGWFQGVWNGLKNIVSNVWDGILKLFTTGGKIFGGVVDGIASVFKKIVNGLIDGINWVVAKPFEGINGLLNNIRGFSIFNQKPFEGLWGENPIPVPKIPKLATGAVIPPNSEFLAVLGDQKRGMNIETPLDTMVQAFQHALSEMGINGGGNPYVNVYLDGVKLSRELYPYMSKESNRKGGSLVTVV